MEKVIELGIKVGTTFILVGVLLALVGAPTGNILGFIGVVLIILAMLGIAWDLV